ncbi:MAG: amino acid adenylation domain-containing protein [Chitinophagaceae bacterium]
MSVYQLSLNTEHTRELLHEASQAYHTEINDILLAALLRTLSGWNDNNKLVIGLEAHGREAIIEGVDTSRTTGWFTTLYPILLELPEESNNSKLLKSVKEQIRNIPDKGIGYGVLKYISKEGSLQNNQPWDIVFNYLGQSDNIVNRSEWFTAASEPTGNTMHEKAAWTNKLEINSIVSGGELLITWNYSKQHFEAATIHRLAQQYAAALEELIGHCMQQSKTGSRHTPSDFSLPEINYQELDNFLEENINGIPRRQLVESMYRLSGLQEGILFHGLYDKSGGAYMQQVSFTLTSVNIGAFTESWDHLLKSHSILRTGFYYDVFPIPVQCVFREAKMSVEIIDIRGLSDEEQLAAIKEYETADLHKGFDFTCPPLMRIALLQLDHERYRMLWTMHHLPMDGWSMPVLIEEFLQVYDSLVLNHQLPALKNDRYEDYIRHIEQIDKTKEEQHWRDALTDVNAGTLLPFISSKVERTKTVGAFREETLTLNPLLVEKVQQYAQAHRVTVNTVMQGVWSYLLHRYTGESNIVYGVTVSGRPADLPGVEDRVGMYINAIPLHSRLNEEQTATAWLQDIQEQQLRSSEFQYTALSDIQRWIGVQGDLFDSILMFQNFPVSKIVGAQQWQLQVDDLKIYEPTSNYPFSIKVMLDQGINIQFAYKEELLDVAYVKKVRSHFAHVLDQLVADTDTKFCDINLLTDAEQQQLTEDFNSTDKEYPKNITIPELFEQQVSLYADETALVFQDEQLTYRELDELSNQLAYYLRSKGVKEEMLVPVCMDRSIEMVVAIMGVLKAGGAYVPIDPAAPPERISYMLEDTGAMLIITTTDYRELLAHRRPDAEFICMDTMSSLLPMLPSGKPDYSITENNLAYIIYTSGSTGLPKGVMIEHRGVINLTYNQVGPLNLRAGIRVFQFASFSFDASCHEVFTTLLHGGRLVLAPKETLLDTKLLAELLNKHEIELVTLPPSYQSAIGDEIGGLKTVISAGEMLNIKLAAEIQQKGIRLINAYGPTENTVSSILSIDPLHASGCVTIGKPLDNVKAYILDSRMQPVPVGVTGELYLGGVQLARGYWNRPELTAERFVVRPSTALGSDGPSTSLRMYRTGDFARWLPDGNIEYIGRADDQVKIRGYRVELGEIETVLQQAAGVRQGAVIAKEDKQGTKKLIAYVSGEGLDKENILTYLKTKLPDYMVPGILIELEFLPLNNSGKVDRKRLPDAESLITTTEKHTAARNETEVKLIAIWQELLEVERVGIEDDFFELGGHSLLAIQLISAMRKAFGKEIAIKEVFDHPTIGGLSKLLSDEEGKLGLPLIEVADRPENIPLSFAQERLWFVHQLQGSIQYHMPWIFRLTGAVDIAALKAAFRTIVNRHEVLRTIITEENGIGRQVITPADQWQLQYVDSEDIHARGTTYEDYVSGFIAQPFDLSQDPALRAVLISLSAEEHVLVMVLHHIAFDGWSISIMVEELAELYRSRLQNSTAVLKKLPVQYADYAIWQRQHLSGELLETKLAWWKQQLNGVEALNLQTDHQRAAVQSIKGGIVHRTIEKEQHQKIIELSKQQGTTLYMTLLSVFKILLNRYSGQTDICVGSPVAGRDQQEIEGLIGFFVNTLALRSDLSEKISFEELLQRVRQTTLNAYEHQDVPFEKVVETVGVTRDLSRTPLFQVQFSFTEMPQSVKADLGGVTLQSEESEGITSKYDLSLTATQAEEELHLSLNYCSDLFNEDTIERMLVHYENLLRSALQDVHTPLSDLQILSATEEKLLTEEINTSATTYPANKNIVDLFEEQAARTPPIPALVFEGHALSYKDLNERANRLAFYLQSKGVKAGDLVPVCIGRSLEVMVGILGILKAGGAYVPVDPDYPQARIHYMIDDTRASVILTTNSYASLFAGINNKEVICIDGKEALANDLPSINCKRSQQADGLVYVIYTSGSTGTPKGVMIKHISLVDYVYGLKEKTAIDQCSSFALVSTISADLGNTVIYSSLAWGGTLHLFSADTINDPDGLHNYFSTHAIDCVKIVPSHWKALSANGQLLLPRKMIVFGGEALPADVVSAIHEASAECTVVNHYGPTETTIGKLLHVTDRNTAYQGIIPVGKPFSNTRVYVLNRHLQPCPVGVAGELYISGDGVAVGYINNPEMTATRFTEDPFRKNGSLMYRTGDQVKYLPDGNILFLGRIDNQVKIRGYRIELGEIEMVLQQADKVEQCVVIADEDLQGNKRLVAYVVTNAGYEKEATRKYLKANLPDHMIPSIMLEIESIPLTANGKVDRKRLPAVDMSMISSTTYEAPRNATEEKLAAIWCELLGLRTIGVYDNFFESGGHSLLGMRMISAVRKTFSLAISVHAIFQFTCINDLAKYIDLELNNNLQLTAEEVDVIEL